MSLSRRKFMQAGVVAACVALPLKSALGQNGIESRSASPSSKVTPEQLRYYTEASFTPYMNTRFSVYVGTSDTRGLKLVQVSDYLSRSLTTVSSSQAECFSLLFTIPRGRAFEQDTYLIEHEALGSFYMFMVPVSAQGKKSMDYYEAIVYRDPALPTTYDDALLKDTQKGGTQSPVGRSADGAVPQASGQTLKTKQEVFYFRPKEIAPPPSPPVDPGAAGRLAAKRLSMAEAPDIGGLRLGMTIEQVLALFPGIKNDAVVRSNLSRPVSPSGMRSLLIRPEKYSTENRFIGVSEISVTFLDGRASILNVGYDGPVWGHVDEFVAKFSGETGLPGADSWDAFSGMDTQLKTLKCMDFEVSVFAGGENVDINYVQMRDLTAQQRVQERAERARKLRGEN